MSFERILSHPVPRRVTVPRIEVENGLNADDVGISVVTTSALAPENGPPQKRFVEIDPSLLDSVLVVL